MKIARRGFEVCVTQQGLNHEQVHSLVQQMRRKRVAQRMRMNRFSDAGLLRCFLASPENTIRSDGAIRHSPWKKPLGGTLPAPVRREQVAQRLGQHHLSVLVSFATANPDRVSFPIE